MTALIVIIVLALVFDFINGFHDAANSVATVVATVVSTRVLSPNVAVAWAAFFNFVAFLLFDTHVAGNIARGVRSDVVSLRPGRRGHREGWLRRARPPVLRKARVLHPRRAAPRRRARICAHEARGPRARSSPAGARRSRLPSCAARLGGALFTRSRWE